MLEVCEQFVTDLKFVAYRVQPCFPPEFQVMKLYVDCYENTVMERINSYMQSMDRIVEKEPQAVLAFNKFVLACADVQKELRIELASFLMVEVRLRDYQLVYIEYLAGKI